ncbi:hypothetical protein [Chryseobacterium gambrini]|uniref:hypothetical protein n=1 Tax=Chryseobacterium gambrini TaxID=373672 RepID=UPI0022F37EE7|nr:hypothetical protein [Chryseobacterium gambrini]WBX98251.1 hypothetical protein PE065_03105 [Chryseobacterium gambrini]
MKIFNRVKNSSKYWGDFESEYSSYYYLRWIGEDELNKFINNELDFFKKYILLTNKYGFALPVNCNENNLVNSLALEKSKNQGYGKSSWYFMFHIYQVGDNLIYPSDLFIDLNDKSFKTIVNIDPIIELKDDKAAHINYAPPVNIELREKNNKIELIFYLDNDVFNSGLENKKCFEFEYPINNSDLAYLNTPRLNSFLRDLKILCFEFGASEFEFENLGLQDFNENGVFFNEEILFYEDIYDLLPEEHKYKPFKEIQVELNDTNYKKYLKKNKEPK